MRKVAVFGLILLTVALGAHLALAAWVFARLQPAPLPVLTPPAGVSLSASSCAGCHPDQYAEWAGSMMGLATRDPVYVADFEHQGNFVCHRCHAPLAEQQPEVVTGLWSVVPLVPRSTPNPDFDPALYGEGVTCTACHLRDGAMVGPLEQPRAPHPTRKGSIDCARCHQLDPPPLSSGLDRPISDTHGEHERWGGAEDCVDCHMPVVQRSAAVGGPVRDSRVHTFHGAWNDAMVRSAVEVVGACATSTGVEVTLRNRAGHNVPTGEPGRALVVQSGGVEVVLARRIPLPKYQDIGDTSLLPGETRRIVLDGARGDTVELVFDRLRFFPAPVVESIPASKRRVNLASLSLQPCA